MDRFTGVSTEELVSRIRERQALLEKIVDFVETITREKGERIRYYQGNSHTNVVRRLDGFGHFSFLSDTGQSMMGGNTFSVWYHPTEERIDTKQIDPVLSVYYGTDMRECKVEVFDESGDWQSALEHVMEHKNELIAQLEKEKKDRREQRHLQTEEDRKRAQVLADAERLKL